MNPFDGQLLDLIAEMETREGDGQVVDTRQLAAGDEQLARQLEEETALLKRYRLLLDPNAEPSIHPVFQSDRTTQENLVGPYQLVEKLGQGGMGTVYKARHTRLGKYVAIKIVAEHLAKNGRILARFDREMKAIGALDHPNIIRAMHADAVNGIPYLVMEYVEGQNLYDYVKQHQGLPVPQACRIVRDAAVALAYAHENGIIHRDIKPSNLILSQAGQVKVLDLGLIRLIDDSESDSELTAPGASLGTPDFMAPEQWKDSRAVDPRTDIYALGCTLYFLLVGHAPYGSTRAKSVISKMTEHTSGQIPALCEKRPDVPKSLDKLYQKLLAKDPAQRVQSAAELARLLVPFCKGEAESTAIEQSLESEHPSTIARTTSSVTFLKVVVAVVIVTLLTAATWAIWQSRNREAKPSAVEMNRTDAIVPPVAETYLFGNGASVDCAISKDGRWVAFTSAADNLVAGDTNDVPDVFVKDLQTGHIEVVSAIAGQFGDKRSAYPTISGDGRLVAFQSFATNLVPGAANNSHDIYVRDMQTGEIIVASVGIARANQGSYVPRLSGDGRYVTFSSFATNLVEHDLNQNVDVFRKDLATGEIELVSCNSEGEPGNGASDGPAISNDGRFIAFFSTATNLCLGDDNGVRDVFLKDMQTGRLTLISATSQGEIGNQVSQVPDISGDGRFVVFYSLAANLYPHDSNGTYDVFLKDLQTQELSIVSIGPGGLGDHESINPRISDDGSVVVFRSDADNLVAGDNNGVADVFLKNLLTGQITRISTALWGEGNGPSLEPAINGSGTVVAFQSNASNFLGADTNGATADVFVTDVAKFNMSLVTGQAKDPGGEATISSGRRPAVRGKRAAARQEATWKQTD